jgi:hypothetical protein
LKNAGLSNEILYKPRINNEIRSVFIVFTSKNSYLDFLKVGIVKKGCFTDKRIIEKETTDRRKEIIRMDFDSCQLCTLPVKPEDDSNLYVHCKTCVTSKSRYHLKCIAEHVHTKKGFSSACPSCGGLIEPFGRSMDVFRTPPTNIELEDAKNAIRMIVTKTMRRRLELLVSADLLCIVLFLTIPLAVFVRWWMKSSIFENPANENACMLLFLPFILVIIFSCIAIDELQSLTLFDGKSEPLYRLWTRKCTCMAPVLLADAMFLLASSGVTVKLIITFYVAFSLLAAIPPAYLLAMELKRNHIDEEWKLWAWHRISLHFACAIKDEKTKTLSELKEMNSSYPIEKRNREEHMAKMELFRISKTIDVLDSIEWKYLKRYRQLLDVIDI